MTQAIIYSTNILGAAAISNPLFLFTLFFIFYFILFIFYHSLDYPLPSFVSLSLLLSCFYFDLSLLFLLSPTHLYHDYYDYWCNYECFRFISYFFISKACVTFTTIRPKPYLYILDVISLAFF